MRSRWWLVMKGDGPGGRRWTGGEKAEGERERRRAWKEFSSTSVGVLDKHGERLAVEPLVRGSDPVDQLNTFFSQEVGGHSLVVWI